MPCVYTQWVDAHCCLPLNTILNFANFEESEENVENVFLIMIGQAMDFYLASDSSPAIHSKTTAKVRKRIGICKKIGKFLANPNKIGYKAAYIQGFCPYRAQGNNALIPRAMPWARSFCPLPFRYAPVTVGSGRAAVLQ